MENNIPMLITLLTLAVAVVLLVSNFIRNDVVAVLIIVALLLSGVLEPAEALSGFSSTAVVIIAGMFIVGQAVTYTGIAQQVGNWILRYGGTSEVRLLIMIMLAAGLVGSFMSSTATAAIFIPITLSVAEKAGINHKRLLMPLAAASLVSGMMTLIATTPNIVVSGMLHDRGLEDLSFFSFTPFGVLVLILAIAFMAVAGREMLASRKIKEERKRGPTIDELLHYHQIDKNEYFLRVPVNSDLLDRTVSSVQLGARHHVILLAVQRGGRGGRKSDTLAARPEIMFKPDDVLMLIGAPEYVEAFAAFFTLQQLSPNPVRRKAFFQIVGIAEVMLSPESSLIGKSLRESQFQSAFHSMVLGIRRKGETLVKDIADKPLSFGDVLLVCGAWTDIVKLKSHKDKYLLLSLPQDYKEYIPGMTRRGVALAILAGMVVLMAFNVTPPVSAILAASAALVLARCVPLTSIYDVIDWQTVVMIAGIMPLALALQKTGVITHVSTAFLDYFSTAGELPVLAGLFVITAFLGLFMSNTAVALLVAPMAIDVGLKLNISPQACVMVVAIGCSSAFMSPLGSPVNMIVREPGGYSFGDYFKVGLPMLLLSLGATLLLCEILHL